MATTRQMVLFNVKIPPDLAEMIDHATRLSGSRTRSDWAREALEAGARREIAAEEERRVRMQTGHGRGGGFVVVAGKCVHPLPARRKTMTGSYCAVCLEQLTRTG